MWSAHLRSRQQSLLRVKSLTLQISDFLWLWPLDLPLKGWCGGLSSSVCSSNNCFIIPDGNHVLAKPNPLTPSPLVPGCLCCTLGTPHISGLMQYLPFSFWFISLSAMFPRFAHTVACVPLCVFPMLFVHSSADGHLGYWGCFRSLLS